MKGLWNEVKWFFQRGFRGYDDRLFWAMDEYLSPIIVAGLKNLRKNALGYPAGITSQNKWNKILDKMIFSFEYDKFEYPFKKTMKDLNKVEEGHKLFAEYYSALWD